MAPHLGGATKGGEMCQNCLKTVVQLETKLLRCSGCKRCNYCSRECQAAHWKTHKPQCKLHLQNDQIYREMEEKYPDLYPNAVEVARKLADWQKIHRSLFQIALCGALGLANNPYRCSTDLLHVTLAINPRPNSPSDAASAFVIVKTEVRPIASFLASENENEDMRASLAAACNDRESQTTRFRERNPDAPGVCLLIAYLEQYNMGSIVPVAVSDSPRPYGAIHALWEDIFHTYTAQGRRL